MGDPPLTSEFQLFPDLSLTNEDVLCIDNVPTNYRTGGSLVRSFSDRNRTDLERLQQEMADSLLISSSPSSSSSSSSSYSSSSDSSSYSSSDSSSYSSCPSSLSPSTVPMIKDSEQGEKNEMQVCEDVKTEEDILPSKLEVVVKQISIGPSVPWTSSTAKFQNLHEVELTIVFKFLNIPSLVALSKVNRHLRVASSTDAIWSAVLTSCKRYEGLLSASNKKLTIKERYCAHLEPPKYFEMSIPREFYLVMFLSILNTADLITDLLMVEYFSSAGLTNFLISSIVFFFLSPLCLTYVDWDSLDRGIPGKRREFIRNIFFNFFGLRMIFETFSYLHVLFRRLSINGTYHTPEKDRCERDFTAQLLKANEGVRLVKLLEGLLQSCPQALLQTYLLVAANGIDLEHFTTAVISIVVSVLSVAVVMTFMSDQRTLSSGFHDIAVVFSLQFCTLLSRMFWLAYLLKLSLVAFIVVVTLLIIFNLCCFMKEKSCEVLILGFICVFIYVEPKPTMRLLEILHAILYPAIGATVTICQVLFLPADPYFWFNVILQSACLVGMVVASVEFFRSELKTFN